MSSRFCAPVYLLLLAGCAPTPPDVDPPATLEPPTFDDPVDTGSQTTADTGALDTDEPQPNFSCEGDGEPSLILGRSFGPSFEPFADPAQFPYGDGRLVLTVRSEGLDTTEPVLVVVRVGEPGSATLDTIGQRYLICGENHGWIELEVGAPAGLRSGDPVQVSSTLTDHRGIAGSVEVQGFLN